MTDYTELMRRAKESTGISDVSVAPDVLIGLFTDLDEARNGMKYSCAIRLKKEIERLESEAVYSAAGFDAAREEIARLKAEVAGLRTGYEAYERVNAELKAEVERHRAYADKCESAAAGFSRQLQTALIELKALQGEKAAQGAIRKERQAEGIEKARAEGKYQGRPVDADLHARVIDLLQNGHGVRPTARLAKCSTTTVIRIKAALSNGEQS